MTRYTLYTMNRVESIRHNILDGNMITVEVSPAIQHDYSDWLPRTVAVALDDAGIQRHIEALLREEIERAFLAGVNSVQRHLEADLENAVKERNYTSADKYRSVLKTVGPVTAYIKEMA